MGGRAAACQIELLELKYCACCFPLQVASDTGSIKIAANSRQIAAVLGDKGPRVQPCATLTGLVQVHFVDAVLSPDPEWEDDLPPALASGPALEPSPSAAGMPAAEAQAQAQLQQEGGGGGQAAAAGRRRQGHRVQR